MLAVSRDAAPQQLFPCDSVQSRLGVDPISRPGWIFLGTFSNADEHEPPFNCARATVIKENFKSTTRQVVSLSGYVESFPLPQLSALKRGALTMQELFSPQGRWGTVFHLLNVTAALVGVFAAKWLATWIIRDAQNKLASGIYWIYVNGVPSHQYGRWDTVGPYVLGIVMLLGACMWACSAISPLYQKVQSVYQRCSHNVAFWAIAHTADSQGTNTREILIGSSPFDIVAAMKQTLEKAPKAEGNIPHPSEDRDMVAEERAEFVRQVVAFFSLRNPQDLINCWSSDLCRIEATKMTRGRAEFVTRSRGDGATEAYNVIVDTIRAKRSDAFLRLLPPEITNSGYFNGWVTSDTLTSEALHGAVLS